MVKKLIATKHPEIRVRLSNTDGNAFNIIGLVSKALRDAKTGDADEFIQLAFHAESYDELLQICMRWVKVS